MRYIKLKSKKSVKKSGMLREPLYSEDISIEVNIESTAFYDKGFAYVTSIVHPNPNLLIVKIRTRDKDVTVATGETFGVKYDGWYIAMSTILEVNHDELPNDYVMNEIVISTEGFTCDHVEVIDLPYELEILMMRDTFTCDDEVDYTVIDWNKNKDSSLKA